METFPPLLRVLARELPEHEFYMVDQRGTGGSERLHCAAAQAPRSAGGAGIEPDEVAPCVRELVELQGDDFAAFGYSEAAHDLAALMLSTAHPDVPEMVYGVSAGTLLAQRLLLLYPELIDRTILEAPVPPDYSGKLLDEAADEALRHVLMRCAADAACGSRFQDPLGTTSELWRKMQAGHCAELGTSAREVQKTVFALLGAYPLYALIPALLARLDRCAANDLDFLQQVLALRGEADVGKAYSEPLNRIVTAAEIWQTPLFPSEAEYLEFLSMLHASSPLGAGAHGDEESGSLARWPKYRDELDDVWPRAVTPILMLRGELDSRLTQAGVHELAAHYAAPEQSLVSFPSAAHNALGATPTPSRDDCALRLTVNFLRGAGGGDVCSAATIAPDFLGRDFAQALLGLPTYW